MSRQPSNINASHDAEQIDVAIIGGGIAGLTIAYRLRQRSPHLRVALLEASDRCGGKILSETVETDDGRFIVEGGPDAFLAQKPWAKTLVEELGIGERLIPVNSVSAPVSILKTGRLVALPAGVSLLAPTRFGPFLRSPLLSKSGKVRVLREMGIPASLDNGDESVAAFVTRRLGSEAVDWLAEPLLAGIYNAEPERMSLLATFPQFRTLEKEHGSLINGLRSAARAARDKPRGPVFLSLRGGMQELTDTLTAQIGAIIRSNTTVQHLERLPSGHYRLRRDRGQAIIARSVVVTLPAIDSARLLQSVAPAAANELARLRTVGAGSISLAYRNDDIKRPLPGYGLVIPRRENRPINAITVTSAKFAGRAPEGWTLMRVFFGGARSAESMFYNDDRLLKVVREQLHDLLGIEAEPAFHRLYRWRTGSPQYDVGHLLRIAAIESALPDGLLLAGGTYHGVGIPDIVRTATEIAERIAARVTVSPGPGPARREWGEFSENEPAAINIAFPLSSDAGEGARG